MREYLEWVDLPYLTDAAREKLDSPLTHKEIQVAVKSLQSGKTPGPDGYPAEFYKQYADDLLPTYRELLVMALEGGTLPPSMSEAVIVFLPKPGKNPELCSSYRPISLLNVDLKILAKVLAGRLNSVITALIHPDQSGFMLGRGTDINIRRLLTHMDKAPEDSLGVVVSLDAEKAFDSVEWEYLWTVLWKFGFGPKFIKWLRMMYAFPRARVRTNNSLSQAFPLGRGTRQGCPLSPGLFALAVKPLALRIRDESAVWGIQVGVVEEKISLYADDTILYLNDVSSLLPAALQLVNEFGSYSEVRVNWDKSLIYPLNPARPKPPMQSPLVWVDSFKYLGICMGRPVARYMDLNLMPLLAQFSKLCTDWRSPPLTLVDRVNLVKMVFLPKFLYLFRNSPLLIPASYFNKLKSIVSSILWLGKVPRLALSTLQSSLGQGGSALPNFQLYYWAAILVTARWWFSLPRDNPAVTLEAAILGSYAALSNLVFRGVRAHPNLTTLMRTTIMVWHRARAT